jgi:hypothetical protein
MLEVFLKIWFLHQILFPICLLSLVPLDHDGPQFPSRLPDPRLHHDPGGDGGGARIIPIRVNEVKRRYTTGWPIRGWLRKLFRVRLSCNRIRVNGYDSVSDGESLLPSNRT